MMASARAFLQTLAQVEEAWAIARAETPCTRSDPHSQHRCHNAHHNHDLDQGKAERACATAARSARPDPDLVLRRMSPVPNWSDGEHRESTLISQKIQPPEHDHNHYGLDHVGHHPRLCPTAFS